jgi:hypothetical protein
MNKQELTAHLPEQPLSISSIFTATLPLGSTQQIPDPVARSSLLNASPVLGLSDAQEASW